jgi:menaquinol-cytochrome c reductase iron-sulfur subunit
MERRTFLRWAVHGLGAVFGAVLGLPAVVYLIDPRNRPAPPRDFRPVGQLKELQLLPNEPREVVIRLTRRDAWTLHPNEVVGRVWLILRERPQRERPPQIDAFTTTCPHLGCSINYTGTDFLCPCHGAHFTREGLAIRQVNNHPVDNPAKRDMDSLELRVERVPGTPNDDPDYVILVKYEKFESNIPEKKPVA